MFAQTKRFFVFVLLSALVTSVGLAQQSESTAEDLFDAARNGDVEQIKLILDSGIDINSKTKYGAMALHYAAEKGHLDAVKLLVEKGAELNSADTFYNWTPLSWATISGHADVAKFLKEKGAKQPVQRARPSASKKKLDTKKADEAEKIEFLPSSDESRFADRQVSKPHWPQFRGTGSRGVADGQHPPLTWHVASDQKAKQDKAKDEDQDDEEDEDQEDEESDDSDLEQDKNLLFKTKVPGLGHSCPTIWGDFVYLTSAVSGDEDHSIKIGNYGGVGSVDDDSEHRFILVCINKNDGTIVWEQEATRGVPKVKRHLKSTHANSTVATDGDHVVAFFGGEGLYCYTNKGELLWKKDLGKLDSGWFYDKSYQWGFGSSPVIFEDMVIVQCDVQEQSFLAAYRLRDGSEVWKTERDEIPGWSSPNVVDSPHGPMVLTHATKFAMGYSARTGEEIWRFGRHSEIVVPTPFVAHDLIYLTSGYSPIQPITAIELNATGDVTLQDDETSSDYVRWYKPRGGPYMPSPIVYGDYLYLCANQGILTCIQATTGEQVYKTRLTKGLAELDLKPKDVGGSLSMVGSPIAADGHLYFPAESGAVLVVKAGPEYELVAVNMTGEHILTTPAISEGVIYIRGQEHLIALKQEDEK